MLSSYKGFDYTGLMSPEFVPLDIPSAETPTPEPPKSPVEPSVSSPQGAMTALEAQEAGNPAWEQLTAQQKGTVPIQRDIRQMTPEQQDIMGGAARITEANKQAALDAGVPQSVVDRALQWGVNIKAAGWGPEIPVTGGLTEAEFATQGVTRWGEATGVSPIGVPSTEAGVTTPSGVMPPGAGIPTQPQKPTTIEPTQASKYAWDTYYDQEKARLQQEEDQQIAKIEANYAVKGVASKVATRMGAGNIADLKKQYAAQKEALAQEQKIVNAQLLPWWKEGSLNVALPQTPKRVSDLPPTRDAIYKRYGLPEPTPTEQGGDGWKIPPKWFQHNVPNALWLDDGTLIQASDANDFRNLLLSVASKMPISHNGEYEDTIETTPYAKLQYDEYLSTSPMATKENRHDFRLEMQDELRAGNITQELYNKYFTGQKTLEQVYRDSYGKLGSPVSFKPVIRQMSTSDFTNEQAKLEPLRYAEREMLGRMAVIYEIQAEMEEIQDTTALRGKKALVDAERAGREGPIAVWTPIIPDDWIDQTTLPTDKFDFDARWYGFNPKREMDRVRELAKEMEYNLNKVPPPISGWKYEVKISNPNDGDIVTPVEKTTNGWTVNRYNGTYTNPDGKVFTMAELMIKPDAFAEYKKEFPPEDIKKATDWLNGQDAQDALAVIRNMGETPESKVVLDEVIPPEVATTIFGDKWWEKAIPAGFHVPIKTITPTPEQIQVTRFEQVIKAANIADMSTMDKIEAIFALPELYWQGIERWGTELARILSGVTSEGKSIGEAILNPTEFELFDDIYRQKVPGTERRGLPAMMPEEGLTGIKGESTAFAGFPVGLTEKGVTPTLMATPPPETPWMLGAAGFVAFFADPFNWVGFGVSKAGIKTLPYVVKSLQYGLERGAIKDALIAGELAGIKLAEKDAAKVLERASTMISKNPEASAKWADVIANKGFNAPEAKGLLKEIAESKVVGVEAKVAEAAAPKTEQVAAKSEVAPKAAEVGGTIPPAVTKLKQLVSQFERGTLLEMRAETEALRKPVTKQKVAAAAAARKSAGGGLEGFYAGLRELEGKKPIVEFEAIGKEFTPEEVKELFDIAANVDTRYFQGLNTQKGLHKLLYEGIVPQPKELELLGKAFGNDLIGAIVKQIKAGKWDTFLDVMGIQRALQTTFDISYAMRQAFVMTVSHPIQSSKTFAKAIASWFKKSSAEALDKVVKEDPLYNEATSLSLEEGKRLFLPGVGGEGWQPLYLKEEAVQTRFLGKIGPWVEKWAGKIPKVGKPVGKVLAAPLSVLPRSERAFVFPLNKVRMDKFTNMYRDMERWLTSQEIQRLEMAGKTVPADFTAEVPLDVVAFINRYINGMTGRGNLGKTLNSAGPMLNQFLYSFRYQASIVEAPYYWVKAIVTGGMPITTKAEFMKAITTMSPIRKHAIRDLAASTGFLMSMLSLGVWRASVDSNIKADLNPLSTNFGRIGYKDTYQNIAPAKPWIVFAARLLTGLTKSSTGEIRSINRGELTEDFIRTKLSPQVGLLTDLLYEATVVGEKMEMTEESVKTQIRSRLAPMVINDFIEAWQESGLIGVGMSLLAIPGVSVISYPPYEPKPKKSTLPKVP